MQITLNKMTDIGYIIWTAFCNFAFSFYYQSGFSDSLNISNMYLLL